MRAFFLRLFVAMLVLAGTVGPAAAQTIWTRPYEPTQVGVEVFAPQFENDDVAVASGAAYLTATYSLNDNLELVGELPAARYVADTDAGRVSESTLGNPYLGLGLSSASIPLLVELGARLPLASDNLAATTGSLTDVGRTDAFTPDETLLSLFLNYRFPLFGRQTSLRLRPGLTYAEFPRTNADGTDGTEQDLRFNYHAQLWREGDTVLLGLALTGRAVLTTPGTFGTNSIHHLNASAILDFETVQPGLVVGLSLDNVVRDTAPLFFGLTLSTSLVR